MAEFPNCYYWDENILYIIGKDGFILDKKNKVLIKNGYGAFYCNVKIKINDIEELIKYEEYKRLYQRLNELKLDGYEFRVGPAANLEEIQKTESKNSTGIFCPNYMDVLEKVNRKTR